GGAAAFAIGALILFDGSGIDGFGIAPWLVACMTLSSVGILSGLLTIAVKARNRPVSTGAEGMVGATGDSGAWSRAGGEVLLQGAVWTARSDLEYILKKGDKVTVTGIDGLTLTVRPLT